MIPSPSEIHFLRPAGLPLLPDAASVARFLAPHCRRLPKVQVAEKDGFWFALNNSCLHVARDLESRGRCHQVRVEVVPLSRVPETLQRGMTVDRDDPGRDGVRVGSCRVPATPAEDTSDDTSSDTGTDSDDSDPEEEEGSDSEDDDDLSCNVCDRSFVSARLLSQHQQKKRHFGCSVCNSCFPDLHSLEQHKESLDHWSEDDGNTYESDSEEAVAPSAKRQENKKSEEMERLL